MKESKRRYLEQELSLGEPMGEVSGFRVRPGMFDLNGAVALQNAISFTVHTHMVLTYHIS